MVEQCFIWSSPLPQRSHLHNEGLCVGTCIIAYTALSNIDVDGLSRIDQRHLFKLPPQYQDCFVKDTKGLGSTNLSEMEIE